MIETIVGLLFWALVVTAVVRLVDALVTGVVRHREDTRGVWRPEQRGGECDVVNSYGQCIASRNPITGRYQYETHEENQTQAETDRRSAALSPSDNASDTRGWGRLPAMTADIDARAIGGGHGGAMDVTGDEPIAVEVDSRGHWVGVKR